jgi:hypothetical protein
MGTWYKVTFPSEECVPNGKAMFMQNEFEHLFIANNAAKDVAIFSNHDDLFENHFYYFTPAAFELAQILIKAFNGVPCPQPQFADDMRLVVGHSGARERLLRTEKSD